MDLIEGDPLDAIVKRKEKMPVKRVLELGAGCGLAVRSQAAKKIYDRTFFSEIDCL